MSVSRSRLMVVAAVGLIAGADADAQDVPAPMVIPPGQEPVIARMLGDAATAGCTRTDRIIEPERIRVAYRCTDSDVDVVLSHASAGTGVITARFSVATEVAPPAAAALIAAVAQRVRAAEADFAWISPSGRGRRGPPATDRSPAPGDAGADGESIARIQPVPSHHERARDHGHLIAGVVLLAGGALLATWLLRHRGGTDWSVRR